jgi:predicted TIM-barrel fold metal-dependent hydrolase
MIIDTHLHVIDQSALSYPWLSGEPALNRDFSYETYAREARRVGISTTLHMEVDVAEKDIEAETSYIGKLSEQSGSLLVGAIAACRPEDTGFAGYLERQKVNPFVKGFRRVLHVMPDELSESALFRENVKRLSGSGLTFDLCVLPRQLPKAIALIDLAPDVQFVLDHCGVPDIKADAQHPWREHMAEIAKRPNVVGKISGVVAYADPESWTVETLRPYVEHTIGVFGWDRVVWGSDWPVCTLGGGLSTWVAATHALIAGASADEKARLLSGNAKRIWKLG